MRLNSPDGSLASLRQTLDTNEDGNPVYGGDAGGLEKAAQEVTAKRELGVSTDDADPTPAEEHFDEIKAPTEEDDYGNSRPLNVRDGAAAQAQISQA